MATTKQSRKTGKATKAKGNTARTQGRSDQVPPTRRDRKPAASPRPHAAGRRRVGKPGSKHEATASSRTASHEADRPGATFRDGSKGNAIVSLLRQEGGATITQLTKATGWQAHSIRGFLSGTLKKKIGLAIASRKDDDGERRYAIAS